MKYNAMQYITDNATQLLNNCTFRPRQQISQLITYNIAWKKCNSKFVGYCTNFCRGRAEISNQGRRRLHHSVWGSREQHRRIIPFNNSLAMPRAGTQQHTFYQFLMTPGSATVRYTNHTLLTPSHCQVLNITHFWLLDPPLLVIQYHTFLTTRPANDIRTSDY